MLYRRTLFITAWSFAGLLIPDTLLQYDIIFTSPMLFLTYILPILIVDMNIYELIQNVQWELFIYLSLVGGRQKKRIKM